MSHWAEIDENNFVIRVLVGDNNEIDEGKSFMESLGGRWIQTSYNSNFRKHFAGIGYFYNEDLDAFIPPKPINATSFDEVNCVWIVEEDETL